ncbi:hypothetical protein ROZALSC1DRAFT_31326, partial [Rozella allomycis CSF55]
MLFLLAFLASLAEAIKQSFKSRRSQKNNFSSVANRGHSIYGEIEIGQVFNKKNLEDLLFFIDINVNSLLSESDMREMHLMVFRKIDRLPFKLSDSMIHDHAVFALKTFNKPEETCICCHYGYPHIQKGTYFYKVLMGKNECDRKIYVSKESDITAAVTFWLRENFPRPTNKRKVHHCKLLDLKTAVIWKTGATKTDEFCIYCAFSNAYNSETIPWHQLQLPGKLNMTPEKTLPEHSITTKTIGPDNTTASLDNMTDEYESSVGQIVSDEEISSLNSDRVTLHMKFRKLETRVDYMYEESLFATVMKFSKRQWMLNIVHDVEPYGRLYSLTHHKHEFIKLHNLLKSFGEHWKVLPIKHPSLRPYQVEFNILSFANTETQSCSKARPLKMSPENSPYEERGSFLRIFSQENSSMMALNALVIFEATTSPVAWDTSALQNPTN